MRIALILLGGAALAGCGVLSQNGPSNIRWSGTQPGQPVMGDAASYYAQGKAQLSAGNAALAIDHFRKALRIDPRSIDALNGLGAAYDRIGRYDLSRNYYEQALGLDPNARMTLNNFGYSLAMQGKAEEAKPLLARAASAGGEGVVSVMAARNLAQVASSAPAARANRPAAPSTRLNSWIERLTSSTQLLVTRLLRPASAPWVVSVDREAAAEDGDRPAHYAERYHRQRLPLNPALLAGMMSDEVMAGTERDVGVLVLNGAGRRGMAGRMAAFLTGKGYARTTIGDARQAVPETEILYPAGQADAAAAIAARLPFAVRLKEAAKVRQITITLGADATRFDARLHSFNRTV